MDKKCHDCAYSGPLPYETHICCCHPVLDNLIGGKLAYILYHFNAIKRMGFKNVNLHIQILWDEFEIKAMEHGIKKGWFNWPLNFDPVWLENCNAFEEKACTPSENDI